MNRKEISDFIVPYMTIFESDSRTEVVDCLLKKELFNKEKIEQDKTILLDFMIDNISLKGYRATNAENTNIPKFDFILPIDLLKRPDGSVWNEFEYYEDLETLERIVGLLKMLGIVDKSKEARDTTLKYLRPRKKYLDPSYRDNFDFFKEYKYYNELYEKILPVFTLKLNVDVINKRLEERMNENIESDTVDIDTKELLMYWWNNYRNIYNDTVNQRFEYYLNDNPEEVLNIATYLTINDMGPIALSLNLINGETTIAGRLNYLLSQIDETNLKKFEKLKNDFLLAIQKEYKKNEYLKKKR